MFLLSAAYKSNRRHAVSVSVQSIVTGRNQIGVVRQAKVIVGAQIDNFFAVLKRDGARLLACDDPLDLNNPALLRASSSLLKWSMNAFVTVVLS